MSKPPPRCVSSDDFTVAVEGEVYHPHDGENVLLIGNPTVGELQAWDQFRRLAVDLDALEGEPEERRQVAELLEVKTERLCALLSRRIAGWTWTDDLGRPLRDPAVSNPDDPAEMAESVARLKALTTDELYYLLRIARGEAPAERKNGSSVSPTISSAIAPPPTPTKRGSAPSPTQV